MTTHHRPRPTSLTEDDDDDRTVKSEMEVIPEIIDLCTPISDAAAAALMNNYPVNTIVSTQRWEQFPHLRDRLTILPLFPLKQQQPSDEQGHPLFPNLARKFRLSWRNIDL